MSRDTLSDLLRSVRLRGAVYFYVSLRDQWSAEASAAKEIAEAVMPGCEHAMEYHMVAKGSGWAAVSGLPPVRLSAGDIVMFPQGDRHVISSAPGLEPSWIEPEWVFARRNDPKPLPISIRHGVVDDQASMPIEDADAVLVCGFLGCDLKPFNPLIAALPRILHLPASRAGDWVARVIDQAVVESNERRPGGDAVLERLSEMMFVDIARRYLDSLPENVSGWLAGLRDRFVGKALALILIIRGVSTISPARSACRVPRSMSGSCSTSVIHRCTIWPIGGFSLALGCCANRIVMSQRLLSTSDYLGRSKSVRPGRSLHLARSGRRTGRTGGAGWAGGIEQPGVVTGVATSATVSPETVVTVTGMLEEEPR